MRRIVSLGFIDFMEYIYKSYHYFSDEDTYKYIYRITYGFDTLYEHNHNKISLVEICLSDIEDFTKKFHTDNTIFRDDIIRIKEILNRGINPKYNYHPSILDIDEKDTFDINAVLTEYRNHFSDNEERVTLLIKDIYEKYKDFKLDAIASRSLVKEKSIEQFINSETGLLDPWIDSPLEKLDDLYELYRSTVEPYLRLTLKLENKNSTNILSGIETLRSVLTTKETISLYKLLSDESYIKDTTETDFLYWFGCSDSAERKQILWTVKNKRTNYPSKVSLIDFLLILGYQEHEIRSKINDAFQIEKGKRFIAQDYVRFRDWNKIKSEYHDELTNIVNKIKGNN